MCFNIVVGDLANLNEIDATKTQLAIEDARALLLKTDITTIFIGPTACDPSFAEHDETDLIPVGITRSVSFVC